MLNLGTLAGLVAAIVAGAQIAGGIAAPRIRRLFRRRTSALIATAGLSVLTLGLIGLVESFWAVIGLIVIWGLLVAATLPIRQTYINGLIPSRQRATILSFDSTMSSTGGVWTQPLLGRAADVWGYAPSYLLGAAISVLAIPASTFPPGGRPGRHARHHRGAARPPAWLRGRAPLPSCMGRLVSAERQQVLFERVWL